MDFSEIFNDDMPKAVVSPYETLKERLELSHEESLVSVLSEPQMSEDRVQFAQKILKNMTLPRRAPKFVVHDETAEDLLCLLQTYYNCSSCRKAVTAFMFSPTTDKLMVVRDQILGKKRKTPADKEHVKFCNELVDLGMTIDQSTLEVLRNPNSPSFETRQVIIDNMMLPSEFPAHVFPTSSSLGCFHDSLKHVCDACYTGNKNFVVSLLFEPTVEKLDALVYIVLLQNIQTEHMSVVECVSLLKQIVHDVRTRNLKLWM